jgi:hypothetical protein
MSKERHVALNKMELVWGYMGSRTSERKGDMGEGF